MQKVRIKAVLWDFDGVLGKTMEDNFVAWAKAFSDEGITITQEEYFLYEGMSMDGIAEKIYRTKGVESTLEMHAEMSRKKSENYVNNNNFSLYPGAVKILEKIQGKYKLGLITGSSRERLEQSAGAKFVSLFDFISTADDQKRHKPYPDPYLQALEPLGVQAEECVVVENAPLGVQSAKAAGMYCYAVTSTVSGEALTEAGADSIVSDLATLEKVLSEKTVL